jgi:ABC-type histidine transport system ATPase subunit
MAPWFPFCGWFTRQYSSDVLHRRVSPANLQPSSGGVQRLVVDVLDIVRDLAEAGTTRVLATHEMAFAREVATRVCFLDGGRILESGPPGQVLVEPEQPRTREFLRRVLPR